MTILSAPTILAFSVTIPRVPPKSQIHFQITTHNIGNQRAAKQLTHIRGVQNAILKEFTKDLGERFSDPGSSTYAIFPADVNTCVIGTIRIMELRTKGSVEISPPVPERYNDEACN